MIIDTFIQEEWLISDEMKQRFNIKTLNKILSSFNQMHGGSYFFADYFHKKLIVESSDSRVLCGYPRSFAQTEGLNFFKRILNKDEIRWQKRTMRLVGDIFFDLDYSERQNLMLLYDMNVQRKNGVQQILHYKLIPFQLCENGNLWLALGCVSPAISEKTGHNLCLLNVPALTRYDFVDDMFISYQFSPLTSDEKEILHMLVKNKLESSICQHLNMDKYKYHRTKRKLFKKLEVDTPASAIQRAHHLGLI